MKYLAIFMVFFVIGLSLVPCCAPIANTNLVDSMANCCEDEACSKSREAPESTNNENECSACSPFFTCGACAGFNAQINIIQLTHFIGRNDITYSNFLLQIHSDYFETKWQPPKIS